MPVCCSSFWKAGVSRPGVPSSDSTPPKSRRVISVGRGGQGNPHDRGAHTAFCAVGMSFASDPGDACLLPASMKLWQANLLAYKPGKIPDHTRLLTDGQGFHRETENQGMEWKFRRKMMRLVLFLWHLMWCGDRELAAWVCISEERSGLEIRT